MRPRDYIVIAILLMLGFYYFYVGNFLDKNPPKIPVSENVEIFEKERRYELKKTIVNKVVANQGIIYLGVRRQIDGLDESSV